MAETQRVPVPRVDGDELQTALAFLDFARECVLKKADGLSEDQVRRGMVPTGTSVLRLIRHLTDCERFWFVYQLRGEGTEPDWDQAASDDRPAVAIIAAYRAAIAKSNRIIAEIGDPALVAERELDHRRQSLRWTLMHMITETTRHAGHADIVRELIDGATGR